MTLTILHVEDHKVVADAVRDALEAEGWQVVMCADGAAALNKLAGVEPYDLLITDHELPRATALEIVRYARSLPHRRHIPIIMFTASNRRGEAQTAGVNAYLRKPEDLGKLIETVTELTGRGGSSRPWHAYRRARGRRCRGGRARGVRTYARPRRFRSP